MATTKLAALIEDFNDGETTKLEQECKQKKRLADAERTLQTKETKKALNDKRVASTKIQWSLGKMSDIKRTELKPKDARMFPGWLVPVIVSENGKPAMKLMRYHVAHTASRSSTTPSTPEHITREGKSRSVLEGLIRLPTRHHAGDHIL